MPAKILKAYERFLEAMITYNIIAGGVGRAQRGKCGIPQGCPLSVMVVALIMRAWLVMMKTMSVMPRVLADDVLLMTRGRNMLALFARALNATHAYLHAMGAKVASTKSYNFASVKTAREWLAATKWVCVQEKIAVVKDFRYLGAHLCTQASMRSSTLVARVRKALGQLRRLRYVAAAPEVKAKVVRTTKTLVSFAALRRLTSRKMSWRRLRRRESHGGAIGHSRNSPARRSGSRRRGSIWFG